METLTAQEAQEKLSALIESAAHDQLKFRITSPEGNAILLSEELFENILVTLEMLSTPIFMSQEMEMDEVHGADR